MLSLVGGTESEGVAYGDADWTASGKLLVWFQGTAAVLVIAVSAAVHFKSAPFWYDFQNRLELGLFCSDAFVISLRRPCET